MNNHLRLWYNQHASVWEEALPIGNGRMGAMISGDPQCDIIPLNDDTLWSGYPKDRSNPNALHHLDAVRQMIRDNQLIKAQQHIHRNMLCEFNQSYLPLGNVQIETEHRDYIDYQRELNIDTATARTTYICKGIQYTREYLASAPDNIILIRLTSDTPGSISCRITMNSLLHHHTRTDNDDLILTGRAPSHVDPPYYETTEPIQYHEDGKSMVFESRLHPQLVNGSIHVSDGMLHIHDADEVLLFIACATSYNGPQTIPGTHGKDITSPCIQAIEQASQKAFLQIQTDHIHDYQTLFHRVSLDLGTSSNSSLPTDQRLVSAAAGMDDPSLMTLLFQYGRYLMIASSRPGSQPANLQGIWSRSVRPPWSCNLTTNINAPMNYWPVETCNLSECHQPLIHMIQELSITGEEAARIQFGCRGWTAAHNVDIWRQAAPVGKDYPHHGIVVCTFWPMGGAWLSAHLWEHYLFTQDLTYLRDIAYPLMKGAARFLLDYLTENDQGQLETIPSTSPENVFLTDDPGFSIGDINVLNDHQRETLEPLMCGITRMSTMDLAIIQQTLYNCIAAAKVLNVDPSFIKEMSNTLSRLRPYTIGAEGQLLEWTDNYLEFDIHHRHVSHLYGLHPGNLVNPLQDDAMTTAHRASLNRRGDDGTGWSLAWKINLWARLLDGDHALQLIKRQLHPVDPQTAMMDGGGTYPNMLDAHPPFQIDGNFGATSGIAEMLLQSHHEYIHLLPALPKAWRDGKVNGLRARGGFTVDITWQNGHLTAALITADRDSIATILYRDRQWVLDMDEGQQVEINP